MFIYLAQLPPQSNIIHTPDNLWVKDPENLGNIHY